MSTDNNTDRVPTLDELLKEGIISGGIIKVSKGDGSALSGLLEGLFQSFESDETEETPEEVSPLDDFLRQLEDGEKQREQQEHDNDLLAIQTVLANTYLTLSALLLEVKDEMVVHQLTHVLAEILRVRSGKLHVHVID